MKRALTVAAALMMVIAASAPATAEMVNTGVVEMEQAEVAYLQGLVAGSRTFAAPNPTAATQAAEGRGLVEISAADRADLQDYVSGRTEFQAFTGKASGQKMVSTGRVPIAQSDHTAIEAIASAGRAQRLAKWNALLQN